MKSINSIQTLLIATILLFAFNSNAQTEQKEVFIIGTMHYVPKVIKNSYKPLYKRAEKYNPDAIYVERMRPEDPNLADVYANIVTYSDSLKHEFEIDQDKFDELMNKDLKDMTQDDFTYMVQCFILKKDYANYEYYKYLQKYGYKGTKKSLRNENTEITAKLAAHQNIKYIYSMDDQSVRSEYHKAWRDCAKTESENGGNKKAKKEGKKLTLRTIIPSIFGRHGLWTNSMKTLTAYHNLNSFRYSDPACEPCQDGMKYWDLRNERMAKNIGDQITEHSHQKNLVVVGAGHVVGIKEALEKNYPNITVKIIQDKPYKNKSTSTSQDGMVSQN